MSQGGMSQYIAFLRGINVGGHRVKMARLKELFEQMGFSNVSTFIASGNVIFSSDSADVDSMRATIEGHLAESLGYAAETFIRTPAELESVIAFEPPGSAPTDSADSSLYVIFLKSPAGDDLRASLASLGSAMDAFHVSGREVYWQIQGKLSESPLFGGALSKATRGVPTTSRNITTLRRLASKLGGA